MREPELLQKARQGLSIIADACRAVRAAGSISEKLPPVIQRQFDDEVL